MWFKVDDQFHDHGKLRKIDYDPAAIGLWTLAGSWCGSNRTDGFVPASVLRRWSSSWKRLAGRLELAGLWEPAEVDGERGWVFHDWEDCNPNKDETTTDIGRLRWRRKNALSKNRELCEQIVARDRGLCRYCSVRVNWQDRRGKTGGTYDHVDPAGDNSIGNVVVACRRCNGRKRDRTPEEAGMPLLPVPAPYQAPESDQSQLPETEGASSDQASLRETGRESGRTRVGAGSDSAPVGPVRVPVLPAGVSNGHSNGVQR